MRIICFLSALFFATGAAATGLAADLTKIDRTIAKEPVYQNKPRYCLLVFGPEAKTHVWLVQDGDTLYIDRNGNGNLTEPGERVPWAGQNCRAGDITGSDGKSKLQVSLRRYSNSVRITVVESAAKRYMVGDPDGDPLVFAERASEAPVAHIGGSPSIELSYYWLGVDSMALRVRAGTPGLGKGSFAARVLSAITPRVTPVAEIESPAQNPGAPPIVTKATLRDS
jgi:hypothetical protein